MEENISEQNKRMQEGQSSLSASDAMGNELVAFPTDLVNDVVNSSHTSNYVKSDMIDDNIADTLSQDSIPNDINIADDDGSIFGGIIDAIGNIFD